MLIGNDNENFQFLALPAVVAPETVTAVLKGLSLRGWQIADRWALGCPATVKQMESDGQLIPKLKKQQKLESEIICDARVAGRMSDAPDSEILAMHEISLLPDEYEDTHSATFTVIAIDMFHALDQSEDFTVTGFRSFDEAREYARRRTRDSLEELRPEADSDDELRQRWKTYGEDCVVVGGGYVGSSELDYFIREPATAQQRDWVSLTPDCQQPIALHFPINANRKFSPGGLMRIAKMMKNDPLMALSYIPDKVTGEPVFDPELSDAVHGRFPWKSATLAEKQAAIDEAWSDPPGH